MKNSALVRWKYDKLFFFDEWSVRINIQRPTISLKSVILSFVRMWKVLSASNVVSAILSVNCCCLLIVSSVCYVLHPVITKSLLLHFCLHPAQKKLFLLEKFQRNMKRYVRRKSFSAHFHSLRQESLENMRSMGRIKTLYGIFSFTYDY